MTAHTRLLLVLAVDADDYMAWCALNGRIPLTTNTWAITERTGFYVAGHSRTFQVTDRWREHKYNRKILAGLRRMGVPYGDELGPWPDSQVPDLSWPTQWQRLTRRAA